MKALQHTDQLKDVYPCTNHQYCTISIMPYLLDCMVILILPIHFKVSCRHTSTLHTPFPVRERVIQWATPTPAHQVLLWYSELQWFSLCPWGWFHLPGDVEQNPDLDIPHVSPLSPGMQTHTSFNVWKSFPVCPSSVLILSLCLIFYHHLIICLCSMSPV